MHKTGQYSVEDEIDGVKITSQMFPPLDAYRLAPRVAKLFLPILGAQRALKTAVSRVKDVQDRDALLKALMQIDLEQFRPVLAGILEELAKPENANLPRELLCRTQLHERGEDGNVRVKQLTSEVDINDALRGKLMLMLKLMWFAAAFNFADFFPGGQPNAPIKASVMQ